MTEGSEGNGGQPELGIRQVRLELHKLLLGRRRVWFGCEPKMPIKIGRNDGTAEITLTIEKPAPSGIARKTVLYAFQEADVQKKGAYLGEFVVKSASEKDKQVTLIPTDKLTPREIDRLEKAKDSWILYDILPSDNHEIFAGMSDAQKKALLPMLSPASLQEYLKDGQPAAKDDPKEARGGWKIHSPAARLSGLLGCGAGKTGPVGRLSCGFRQEPETDR